MLAKEATIERYTKSCGFHPATALLLARYLMKCSLLPMIREMATVQSLATDLSMSGLASQGPRPRRLRNHCGWLMR